MAYEEQYSSKQHGPVHIKVAGDNVIWTLDKGGVEYSGSVPIETKDGVKEQEAALWKARRDVDEFQVPAATAVEEPSVLGAGVGETPAPTDKTEA